MISFPCGSWFGGDRVRTSTPNGHPTKGETKEVHGNLWLLSFFLKYASINTCWLLKYVTLISQQKARDAFMEHKVYDLLPGVYNIVDMKEWDDDARSPDIHLET